MANPLVIDTDTHVFEPLEPFDRYLPELYKYRSPRVFRDQWGIIRVLMEGRLYPDPSITAYEAHDKLRGQSNGGCTLDHNAHAGHVHGQGDQHQPGDDGETGLIEGVAMAMGRPGVTDPKARVADLAQEGIDIQIVFGSLCFAACTLHDPGFALAFCRGCNDYVAEFCSSAPDKFKAVSVVPLQDVPAAIAEMRRTVKDLGVVGVSIPPSLPGKNLDHPDFYPFYAEAQALDLAVGIHWGNGTYLPGAGTERFQKHFYNHVVGHPFEQMLALTSIVCGGILERFPKLRFGFLESGCGWVTYWMWRLDEEYRCRSLEVPQMKDKPSEYLKRGNCFFGCSPDESLIPTVVSTAGPDSIVFSSDYPHTDGSFPNTVRTIRDRQDLSEEMKNKILGDNAARFFGLV